MEQKRNASNKLLWIFAVGQLGWSMLSGIVNNWLVFFYQPTSEELANGQQQFIPGVKIFGIFTILGLIAAVGRIFDAVTDPFIAGKSDGLKHKLGRRIPFMRYAAIPFGAVTVLLFISPFAPGSTGNAVLLFLTAMLFYLCMTCYCTPFNALIPELGRTQKARINLSTYISVTYFVGTAVAYLVPNIAGFFKDGLGYAGSYRLTIGILAVIAVICMLIPAFLIDENVYADTKPSAESAFGSLVKTFSNRSFLTFVGSDILYWLALTLFQTGMSYYITVLMGLPSTMTFPLFAVMTAMSFVCYLPVNVFAKKLGKKKLIAFAFMFFAVTFLITGFAGILPIPGMINGVIVAVFASVPMAILGVLPQAVVADIAEADKADTGESRSGMFFAARTFAMKLGQSVALLLFTSISDNDALTALSSGAQAGTLQYGIGFRITAFAATVLCLLGGIVFLRYDEKAVIAKISDPKED